MAHYCFKPFNLWCFVMATLGSWYTCPSVLPVHALLIPILGNSLILFLHSFSGLSQDWFCYRCLLCDCMCTWQSYLFISWILNLWWQFLQTFSSLSVFHEFLFIALTIKNLHLQLRKFFLFPPPSLFLTLCLFLGCLTSVTR